MVIFNFIQILKVHFVSKQCKTLSDVASDLLFQCLLMSSKRPLGLNELKDTLTIQVIMNASMTLVVYPYKTIIEIEE